MRNWRRDHILVTMVMKDRTVPAGEFKAKCLALLDEVAATGQTILVSKRGRPVARVVPVAKQSLPSLRGSVLAEHDLVAPVGEAWDVEK